MTASNWTRLYLGIVALLEGTAVAGPRPAVEWPLPSFALGIAAWHAAVVARTGDVRSAGDELDELDLDVVATCDRNAYWLPTLALLADAAHLAHRPAVADVVATLVDPLVDLTIVDAGLLYRGSVAHVAGLAAATCGRTVVAAALLADGRDTHARHGSPWMVACSDAVIGGASRG